jgi:glycosyltransferase involved in cell wall biosynthesis
MSLTGSPTPARGVCVVLSLDGFGDLVLRQALLSGLARAGYEVHVAVLPGREPLVGLLDQRLHALSLDFSYERMPSAADFVAAVERMRALRPALLVQAQFDRLCFGDWIQRALVDVPQAGLAGGSLASVPGAASLERELGLPAPPPLAIAVPSAADEPEADKNAKLLQAILGETAEVPPPRLDLPGHVVARAREALAARGLAPGGFVALCPAGTVNVRLKAWPLERFASTASWLHRERRLPVLLMGHEAERSTLAEVAERAAREGVSVPQWLGADGEVALMAALLAEARLFVGNDSAPMHLAAAADVPVVAIMGGGHWPRFVPRARRGAVHTQELPCFGCGWRHCALGEPLCVQAVGEREVQQSIARVLDGAEGLVIHRGSAVRAEDLLPRVLRAQRVVADHADRRLDELMERDHAVTRLAQAAEARLEVIHERDASLADVRERLHRREHELAVASDLLPLVSVVTPTFNAARWLERCIETVRSQDYPRIEHIVVDGGSTDGTLEICGRHPHLQVVSAPDRGQSHALNRGFAMARGSILAWLCADDEYRPGAVAAAVRALQGPTDLVWGGCSFVDAEGRSMGSHPANALSQIDHDHVVRFWRYGTVPQPAVFWRRELWERTRPLREDLHFTMDYDLWLRMTRLTSFTRVHADLAVYRIHPDAKCFADNYGSRRELLAVSRSHWPRRGTWRRLKLALDYRLSDVDITTHSDDARRLLAAIGEDLQQQRRLRALARWVRLHVIHPASPKLPGYRQTFYALEQRLIPRWSRQVARDAARRLRGIRRAERRA